MSETSYWGTGVPYFLYHNKPVKDSWTEKRLGYQSGDNIYLIDTTGIWRGEPLPSEIIQCLENMGIETKYYEVEVRIKPPHETD